MHDLRYLAIALIGFFLALATGLLLGSALNSPGGRDRLYDKLRTDFDGLRADIQREDDENKLLRLRGNSRDQAVRTMLPLAVRNRLPGAVVGIVICGNLDEHPFRGALEDALRQAGAEVGTVVQVPDHLRVPVGATRRLLEQTWGGDAQASDPDPLDAAAWVVRAIHRGATTDQWNALETATGIDEISSNGAPARLLLVLSSVPDDARADLLNTGSLPEFKLVEAAKADQMRVVCAEPEDTRVSLMDALARQNIPTVDNVDTASGQVAVVLTLAGADGRFGSKPGAASAIPQLENR